ncbi:MAG: Coenzyme F420 hydrogenase/dehydrogenase, beta subunit C-terminal domain [Kiloniellales bacterium]|nr:Coenzyme F420 hydrogenase/dehydrogenase, beta subunit C-terminal domain [Kiloniellales bacterium]
MTASDGLQRILDEGKCIGCGLCAAMFPDKLEMAVAPGGYLRPVVRRALLEDETEAIYAVCPGVVVTGLPGPLAEAAPQLDEVWGPYVRIDRAHAADPETRHKAATGGALTALCDYLLASGTVAAVLHVAPGGARPAFGQAWVSESREALLAGAGSRYGPAAPLTALGAMLDRGAPFALVAKPCDISAVRLLGRRDPRVGDLITHFLTPVCGGIMPPFAMKAFLARHGIDPDDVAAVSYRGDGCPGPTRFVLKSGAVIEKTYLEFWGTESSQWHLPWRCKICPDGTGEAADIAAADTWPGGSPAAETLDDDPGTNAVLVRTPAGAELLRGAVDAGYLVLEGDATPRDLDHWQPHQVRKKIASGARFDGLRRAGQLGIETIGLRTEKLRARMDPETDRQQLEGTRARIAIGKHRDDFGTTS